MNLRVETENVVDGVRSGTVLDVDSGEVYTVEIRRGEFRRKLRGRNAYAWNVLARLPNGTVLKAPEAMVSDDTDLYDAVEVAVILGKPLE
jgi:hypothetical protein